MLHNYKKYHMVRCKFQPVPGKQNFIKAVNKPLTYSYEVRKMIRLFRADYHLASMSQTYTHSKVAHAPYL